MTAEIRTAVPPEVGVPIPLGDAECRNCTNGFVMGLCGPEDCGCDSGRVPVVPTCKTCGGSGRIPFEHEDAEADATEPCPDCTDGVSRRWVGTVTVTGGRCPECRGAGSGELSGWDADYGLERSEVVVCFTCDGNGSLPDRRYRLQGAVVPVVACALHRSTPAPHVCVSGSDVLHHSPLTEPFDDGETEHDITVAFPVPPAVGTWVVVPDTIEEG